MTAKKRIIAPSLLSADFAALGEALALVETTGADWIHLDVMDGVFVPPITFGSQMTKSLRPRTSLPMDVHLMTVDPARHLDAFAEAGADRLTFHLEAETHAHRLAAAIRDRGMKAGVSIVPSTPVSRCEEILPFIDLVLVMTVNPGWGGQSLIPETLNKVRRLAETRDDRGLGFLIQVDGGINETTIRSAWDAGADVAVVGSAFFGAPSPGDVVRRLREA